MPLSHRGRGSTTTTQLWLPHQRRSRKGCSGFKMLQRVWSQRPGNTSVVCRGWCMMICTGWVFLSGCSTSLLSQSIVVSDIGLQRISPTTVCQFPQFPVVTICDLPDVINCLFHVFTAAPSGLGLSLSPDPQFGTHCLMICVIQLWTLYNFGGTWRGTCWSNIRSVSALAVFTAQCTLVQMRGLGIACRPSVRPSVTLVDCDHISWKSWKLIARTISPTPSLFVANRRSTYSQGNMGKFWGD